MRDFILSEEVLKRKTLSTKNAAEARKISVIVENIKTKEKTEYGSMTEVGKVLGVHRNAVSQAVKIQSLLKKTYLVTKKN